MIKVYFETNIHSELVAIFKTEEMYMKCLPILEKQAAKVRMTVSESIIEKEMDND